MATYLTDTELARLARMAGEAHKTAAERMVDDDDLDDHAFLSRIKDTDGEVPISTDGTANTDYTNTVDLYKAASLAWMQKASIYAEQFSFSADGSTFQRNQAYHAALKQAMRYADMASGHTVAAPAVSRT